MLQLVNRIEKNTSRIARKQSSVQDLGSLLRAAPDPIYVKTEFHLVSWELRVPGCSWKQSQYNIRKLITVMFWGQELY